MELLVKTSKTKETFTDTCGHNIVRLLISCQIFLSPQVKQSLIISEKDGICKLSDKLLNGRILGNKEVSEIMKSQNCKEL